MDLKKFKQRFIEFLDDTNCYGLGPADLETYERRKKEAEERCLREAWKEAYLIEHWFEQEAYVNGTPLKRMWLRLQYALQNIIGGTRIPPLPDYMIMEVTRCLLPDIIAFYETEEGREAFRQWKAQQTDQAETEKSKAS